MFDPDLCWHVATVISGREGHATADLEKRGIVAYYPKETRWKRVQHSRVRVRHAIIPGYVFFRLPAGIKDIAEPIEAVTGYLRNGRGLACIGGKVNPDGQVIDWVQDTRDAEARGEFDGTREGEVIQYRVGQRVKILARSFADRLAVITHVGAREVKADLEATGWLKGWKVTLPVEDVTAI